MPRSRYELTVAPQRQQLGPDQRTPAFPWHAGCSFQVEASGMIWSGVVCTGQTPPGGWGEWRVNDDDLDWPCRGGASRRYGLIGSIDGGRTWFFVGRGTAQVAVAAGDPITLQLAVNRPHPELSAAGDHAWTVTVVTDDDIHSPEVCTTVQNSIDRLRSEDAPDACARIAASNRALSDRVSAMATAFLVAGGFAVALTIVALPVLVPAEIAQNAQQTAAVTAIQTGLGTALHDLSPLGALLSGLVGGAATLATTHSAGTAARANASPVGLTPFGRIAIVALTIAMLAAFAVAIALALSLLTLAADGDNARSDWNTTLARVGSLFGLARAACGGMIDESLPTCAALEG